MFDKRFLFAYLRDLNLINEDRNFFATFKYPNELKAKKFETDEETIEFLLDLVKESEIADTFFELYDHIEIDPNLPDFFKIYFHFNNDDFIDDDKEDLIGQLNFVFDN
jgi:hypothetical protein